MDIDAAEAGSSAGTSESARMRMSIQFRFVSDAMTRYLNPRIRAMRLRA